MHDTYQVRIPESYRAAERNLPHQEIIHPSERELKVLDVMLLEVAV